MKAGFIPTPGSKAGSPVCSPLSKVEVPCDMVIIRGVFLALARWLEGKNQHRGPGRSSSASGSCHPRLSTRAAPLILPPVRVFLGTSLLLSQPSQP